MSTIKPDVKRRIEYVDETPRRSRRSDAEAEEEHRLGHHWVTVLSVERPVPRYFGDNHGMLPIWVESNADWRQSGRSFDQQQPAHSMRAIRLAVIGVRSDEHATKLKKALDEALLGRAVDRDADVLRMRFRNGVDFGEIDAWWPPFLLDVLLHCEVAAADFETFTREEHDRLVAQRVEQRERWKVGAR